MGRKFINTLLPAALAAAVLLCSCQSRNYLQLGGYAQGGRWTVKYNAEGVKARPAQIQKGIEAILEDIDSCLSGYNKASQLSRLNAGDTITPSGMLLGLYRRSYGYWQESGGALDVAAGPLFDIWGFGFKNDSLPSDAKVKEALAISGMGRLLPTMEEALLPDGRLCASRLLALALNDKGNAAVGSRNEAGAGLPQLNFNAVAQGYSCDTVASYLSKLGVRDMLVDIGEIWCRGLNPAGEAWKVGVDRPTDGNESPGTDLDGIWQSDTQPDAPGRGIVTSGNYRKFYVREGRKYAHTIDPRSGYPAENSVLSATIVAPSAEAADAYATICMVIGLEDAKRFISSRSGLEGYLIYGEADGSMAEWRSEGFSLAQ